MKKKSELMTISGEELTVIQPWRMIFLYHLGPDECHKVATGTCSLEKQRPKNPEEMGDGEAHYDYCHKMLTWMEGRDATKGKLNDHATRCYPITLGEYDCGHIAFNDGQHRTCIAQRKGIEVAALSAKAGTVCDFCAPNRRGKNDRLELR